LWVAPLVVAVVLDSAGTAWAHRELVGRVYGPGAWEGGVRVSKQGCFPDGTTPSRLDRFVLYNAGVPAAVVFGLLTLVLSDRAQRRLFGDGCSSRHPVHPA
jgi:hypothetical protein